MPSTLSDIVMVAQMAANLADAVEGVPVSAVGTKQLSVVLTHGTGQGQASKLFRDEGRALSGAATEDLDMFDLAGFQLTTDVLRNTLTFAKVMGLLIVNREASAGTLLVGGKATAAAWSQPFNGDDNAKLKLPPGSSVMLLSSKDGWSVTDASDHILKMEASGGNVTYDVYILGA
jgi:hypothetical protein